jgi:Ca-activated chloride channel family protein
VPATVVLVLDRSASMQGTPMDSAKAGALEFIRHMRPRDQLMVVAFNHQVTRTIDLCAVRDCGERAAAIVDGLFAEGQTALYDTVAESYGSLLSQARRDPRRRYSVIVLSDGKDTASRTARADFLDLLPRGEQYDVPKVFTIAYGGEADRDLLAEIANRTNARLFTSKPEEIAKTYKELSANF